MIVLEHVYWLMGALTGGVAFGLACGTKWSALFPLAAFGLLNLAYGVLAGSYPAALRFATGSELTRDGPRTARSWPSWTAGC